MLYLLGVLTLPALYVLGAYACGTVRLWRAVRRYGYVDGRVLRPSSATRASTR
jgi:hypothetical protein